MSKFVGGYVEGITFPNGDLLLINEEGKLINLPLNPEATAIWRATFTKDKYVFGHDDFVVGPAILIKAKLSTIGQPNLSTLGASAPEGPSNPKLLILNKGDPPFYKKGSHYSRLYCLIYTFVYTENILVPWT